MRIEALLVLVCVAFCNAQDGDSKPVCKNCLFLETFEGEFSWVQSSNDKYTGKADVVARESEVVSDDHAVRLPTSHRHYGFSKLLSKPIDNVKNTFVVQYEVRILDRLDCGGAYMKLLTASNTFVPNDLRDDSPYTIMFGPDKCGSTNKIHLIFRHQNKKTGAIEEKHLRGAPTFPADRVSHLFTLAVKSDNTYELLLDGEVKKSGSLFDDFDPPFQPPKTIADPEDSKPSDWVDEAKIPDPTATKPDDWDEDAPLMIDDLDAVKPSGWIDDEPELIPDPSAEKPEDWDEDDGDFEPPLIRNPKCTVGCGFWKRPTKRNPDYKGKWSAPLIDNPAYKGKWEPRRIDNPAYYEETSPAQFDPIGAIAFELWTTNKDILFDNILISRDLASAKDFAEKTWRPHHTEEKAVEKAKAADDEDVVSTVLKFAEQNPGLMFALVALFLLPILYFCRSSRSQPQATRTSQAAAAARHKKDDDAAGEDDDEGDDDDENDEEGEEQEGDDEEEEEDATEEIIADEKPKAEEKKAPAKATKQVSKSAEQPKRAEPAKKAEQPKQEPKAAPKVTEVQEVDDEDLPDMAPVKRSKPKGGRGARKD